MIPSSFIFQDEIKSFSSENISKRYDISNFQKGMYFLKISNETENIVKKIIIN